MGSSLHRISINFGECGVGAGTSKQSTNSPDTQRRVIENLHGDKHNEPHGRRLLEKLVIVRIYVEFA